MKTLPFLLVAALAGPCSAPRQRPGIPARHLLLVTVAGLRADHTSAWQYQRPTTWTEIDGGLRRDGRALAIDDLAAEGVMFARAFAPSGSTPTSLASLFCGRSPLETGVVDEFAIGRPDQPTLATLLREAGFRTAAFVSGALGGGAEWRRGFDVFDSGENDRDTLGRALDWINARDFGNGQSVLLWVHLDGPSFPFDPQLQQGTFERGGAVDFEHLFVDPSYARDADGSEAFRSRSDKLTPADVDHVIDLYDGEVAEANHLLQLFLDFYLYAGAPSEVWERTLLVLVGTGGVELFESGPDARSWGQTDRLTDSVLHVPLLLRHPDSLTGRRIFAHVSELQDLFPTLLEWFGVDPPRGTERSLLRVTDRGGRGFERGSAFGCRVVGARVEALTVRDERYRLIWTPSSAAPFELVDQDNDRHGLDDLSAQLPQVVDRLRAALRGWLESQDLAPGLDVTAFGVARSSPGSALPPVGGR